jgi:geranylgeranyl diphosphate synthase type 3
MLDYANILSLPLSHTPADETLLLEPFTYLLSNPGKDIRSQLIEAFNVWLRVPSEDLEVIRKVVEMLHTSSLL